MDVWAARGASGWGGKEHTREQREQDEYWAHFGLARARPPPPESPWRRPWEKDMMRDLREHCLPEGDGTPSHDNAAPYGAADMEVPTPRVSPRASEYCRCGRCNGKEAREIRRDPYGGTLLHWTAMHGSGEGRCDRARQIVMYLIEQCSPEVLNLTFDRLLCSRALREKWGGLRMWSHEKTKGSHEKTKGYKWMKFDGQTALHIAVAQRDAELVSQLLLRQARLDCRAWGSFFAPGSPCYYGEYPLSFAAAAGDVRIAQTILEAEEEREESRPVHGKGIMFARDSYGNSALHIAALHDQPGMYDWLLRKRARRRPDVVDPGGLLGPLTVDAKETYRVQQEGRECAFARGAMGLTPLAIAALAPLRPRKGSAGRDDMLFRHVITQARRVEWTWNTVVCYSVDLRQIDSVTDPMPGGWCGCSGGADEAPYLSILWLVLSHSIDALAMNDIILALLRAKWRTVRWMFFAGLVWHAAYLTVLTILVTTKSQHDPGDTTSGSLANAVLIFAVLSSCVFALDFAAALRRLRGATLARRAVVPPDPPDVLRHGPAHRRAQFLSFAQYAPGVPGGWGGCRQILQRAVMVNEWDAIALAGYAFFFFHWACPRWPYGDCEDPASPAAGTDTRRGLTLLGLSCLCAWVSSFTYVTLPATLAPRWYLRTGMLVKMLSRTLAVDVLPFGVVIMFLIIGTTTLVYSAQAGPDEAWSFVHTMDQLKRVAIQIYDGVIYPGGKVDVTLSDEDRHPNPFVYSVLVVFTITTSIVMLNLLIAMLSSTYNDLFARAERSQLLNWGCKVLLLEARLTLLWPAAVQWVQVNDGSAADHIVCVTTVDDSTKHDVPGLDASQKSRHSPMGTGSAPDRLNRSLTDASPMLPLQPAPSSRSDVLRKASVARFDLHHTGSTRESEPGVRRASLRPAGSMRGRIRFYGADQKWGELCASHELDRFLFRDKEWRTVEHAFQAMKFLGTPREDEIRRAPTAARAREIGQERRKGEPLPPDWDEKRADHMLVILRAKFGVPGRAHQRLKSTDGRILLFDDQLDPFWGTGKDGTGKNMLGELLMRVRSEEPDVPEDDDLIRSLSNEIGRRGSTADLAAVLQMMRVGSVMGQTQPGLTRSMTATCLTGKEKRRSMKKASHVDPAVPRAFSADAVNADRSASSSDSGSEMAEAFPTPDLDFQPQDGKKDNSKGSTVPPVLVTSPVDVTDPRMPASAKRSGRQSGRSDGKPSGSFAGGMVDISSSRGMSLCDTPDHLRRSPSAGGAAAAAPPPDSPASPDSFPRRHQSAPTPAVAGLASPGGYPDSAGTITPSVHAAGLPDRKQHPTWLTLSDPGAYRSGSPSEYTSPPGGAGPREGGTWRCMECLSPCDPAYPTCWKCGAPRRRPPPPARLPPASPPLGDGEASPPQIEGAWGSGASDGVSPLAPAELRAPHSPPAAALQPHGVH